MAFQDEYNKAVERLRDTRRKLLREILESPVRDADSMKKYYDAYNSYVSGIDLTPKCAEIGFERFPYLGEHLNTYKLELKMKYNGPERTYVDYGDPNQPGYDLPGIPVIEWEEKHPFEIADLMSWDTLKSNLAVFSDEPIDGVTPDFENESHKYYFPDEVKGEVGEASYDVHYVADDHDTIVIESVIMSPKLVKGNRIYASWTRFDTWLYVFIMPTPTIVCQAAPLPAFHHPDWIRDTRVVNLPNRIVMLVSTGGREWNFMFYNYRFKATYYEQTEDNNIYRYDPIYFFEVRDQTLHPPVLAGRWRTQIGSVQS